MFNSRVPEDFNPGGAGPNPGGKRPGGVVRAVLYNITLYAYTYLPTDSLTIIVIIIIIIYHFLFILLQTNTNSARVFAVIVAKGRRAHQDDRIRRITAECCRFIARERV